MDSRCGNEVQCATEAGSSLLPATALPPEALPGARNPEPKQLDSIYTHLLLSYCVFTIKDERRLVFDYFHKLF